jgi:hypothetical protein
MKLIIKQSKRLLILLTLAFFISSSFGQTTEPQARKFDEFNFGSGNIYSPYYYSSKYYEEVQNDFKARVALYAKQLRLEKSQPYVIAYSPRINKWEIYNRSVAEIRAGAMYPELTGLGFEHNSIKTVNGGFRERPTTELWIVPPGAKPPQPTPTVAVQDVVYCPQIYLRAFPFYPKPTAPIEISAQLLVNNSNEKSVFNWQTSGGKIVAGQGTATIQVEPTILSEMIVVRVDVEGFSLECPVIDSTATTTIAVNAPHYKFDEFGNEASGSMKQRLDNLAIHLQTDISLHAYFVLFEGRDAFKATVERRQRFIKDYLVNNRGLEAARFSFISGGYRNGLETEVWLSSNNAQAPPLTPTVDKKYVRQKLNAPRRKR